MNSFKLVFVSYICKEIQLKCMVQNIPSQLVFIFNRCVLFYRVSILLRKRLLDFRIPSLT